VSIRSVSVGNLQQSEGKVLIHDAAAVVANRIDSSYYVITFYSV